MSMYKIIFFILFFQLNHFLFSQNYVSILPINGDVNIKYFPPARAFANPFYSCRLPYNLGKPYIVNLDGVFNKELGFLVNGEEIQVYVGINDTVNILFDTTNGNYSFSGNNAGINKIYNTESQNKTYYKNMFEGFFLENLNLNEREKIIYMFKNELNRLDKLFAIGSFSTDCIETYKTSRVISMLFWISRAYYSKEDFNDILPELLSFAKLQPETIRNCSRNYVFYQMYYSTKYTNDLQNASSWLTDISYLLHAPEDIKNFMLQSTYIGNYNFAKDAYNWCSLYEELKQYNTETYFEDFFNSHKPCK